jgi:membrane protein implicated in regulation of membrane protease activity
MENLDIAGAVVLFLLLVGAAIYAARRIRGQEMRESEQRRPQDKGKHVEL